MVHAKKWLFGLAMLALAVIVGCSGNSESPSGSNTSSAPSATSGSGGDGTAQPTEKPTITQSIYDRGNVSPDEGTIEDNRWTRWLNENGPVNVDFVAVPRWEAAQKFNTLFASGSAPDLIFDFDTNYRNELYSQKQLLPIDDLIEEHSVEYKALLERFPALRKQGTKPDGKLYEFGRVSGLKTNHILFVRADWLEKLNLEVPKTVEELYEVARAFTQDDPDGNNANDTYGYSLNDITRQITWAMFQAVTWIIEDGKWVREWDRTQAAYEFMKRMYDDGFVDKDFLADKNGEKAMQDFITGKLGIFGANGGAESYGLQLLDSLRKNDPNAKIIPIELPASSYGQFSPVMGNPVQMTAVINASAKDPVAVIKYIDFLVEEETTHTFNYGIEGEHWEQGPNGCPVVIDAEKNKKEKDYNSDFQMLKSSATLGECSTFASRLNPADPLQKEFLEIIDMSKKAYLDPARPMAMVMHVEHMPSIPADLNLIKTNVDQPIYDLFNKALVSGASYTVEMAVKEGKAMWEKAGGKQVEEWYANWYEENKDQGFFTEDMYEVGVNQ